MNNAFLNKWLFFPWQKGVFGQNLIHFDDIDKVEGIGVAKCIGIFDEKYLLLLVKNQHVRGISDGVKKILPNPEFTWTDKVITNKNEFAAVEDLFWHHKDEKFYYFISLNGKVKSRRYDKSDLRSAVR